jgi:hypothetical protein
LSAAGRIEEAKQALFEVSRNYPDLTISKVRQAMVFSDAALGPDSRKSSEARLAGLMVPRAEIKKVSVWSAREGITDSSLSSPEVRD